MKEQVLIEEAQGSHIHGDLLEEVFAHVPLIDLACASRVSKTWEFAVTSSLSHVNKVKPWFIIQTQNTSSFAKVTTHAYDPRSDSWVEVCHLSDPIKNIAPLRCSGSSLFYEICYDRLSFSVDPLHLTWHHIPPPSTWRVDPIVAVVGSHVVVAGGGSGLWDDPLIVEIYDMEAFHWSTCQSMPSVLKDSTASTWLSVASNQEKMYVTEKASSVTYSFNPKTKTWSRPYVLVPDQNVFFSSITFAGDDLILAGLIGHSQDVIALRLWKIDTEIMKCDEIGEIPIDLLDKLKGEDSYGLSSITLLGDKEFVYIYNTSDQAEIIFCEFVGGQCKWGSVKNMVLSDDSKIGERMVMSCGKVGIDNLHMAMDIRNLKFVAKWNA